MLSGRRELIVDLIGLGSFGERVVFIRADDSSMADMGSAAAALNKSLVAADLTDGKYKFNAHATILKRPHRPPKKWSKEWHRKLLKIPEQAWSSALDMNFGRYAVAEVQLLDMRKPKDGYFAVDWEQSFRDE
ncbi:unnamed protein product [Symbiodinium sp. CCMP2456]|nr:unnamed protein product [Symbiodinium sp. CCMP2456]